jgi:hypothetical protein
MKRHSFFIRILIEHLKKRENVLSFKRNFFSGVLTENKFDDTKYKIKQELSDCVVQEKLIFMSFNIGDKQASCDDSGNVSCEKHWDNSCDIF